jgi:hypothetical protein
MKVLIDYLNPKDEPLDDTNCHKRIKDQTKEPILTADNRDYSPSEVKNAINKLNNKKAPGEGGFTGDIYQRVYKQFPIFMNTLYGECLRKWCFPKKWKKLK